MFTMLHSRLNRPVNLLEQRKLVKHAPFFDELLILNEVMSCSEDLNRLAGRLSVKARPLVCALEIPAHRYPVTYFFVTVHNYMVNQHPAVREGRQHLGYKGLQVAPAVEGAVA